MKRPKKGKYPKKPKLLKYKKAPKIPKGGIKTEAQLKAMEEKKRAFNKHCKEVDAENKRRLTTWENVKKAIDKEYNDGLKKFENFKKRVQKVKQM